MKRPSRSTLPETFLEPADGLVIGDEVVGALRGRVVVHAVRGAAHHHAARVPELALVRHRRVPADGGQSLVLLRQGHAAVLRPQRHRGVRRLPGERRQRSVTCVIEAAQTFESMIGESVQ